MNVFVDIQCKTDNNRELEVKKDRELCHLDVPNSYCFPRLKTVFILSTRSQTLDPFIQAAGLRYSVQDNPTFLALSIQISDADKSKPMFVMAARQTHKQYIS